MSSLVDGECPSGWAEEACRSWRDDAQWRERWHTYHLIGDVLRSDELSAEAARDRAFLQRLRSRLAEEPVPLAPSPLPIAAAASKQASRHRRWLPPLAAAAGFVVVGVGVVVLRQAESGGVSGWDNPVAVTEPVSTRPVFRVGGAGATAATLRSGALNGRAIQARSVDGEAADGQVLRDARLDAYFEAHRGAVGSLTSTLPGGALRSVEIVIPQR
jgi:sigma-E factor negative regulatory protein RseA